MTNPQKVGFWLIVASRLSPTSVGVGLLLVAVPVILLYGLVSEIRSPVGPVDSRPVATRITGPVERMAGDLSKYDGAQLEKWFEARPSFALSVAAECAALPKHDGAWGRSAEGKVCTAAMQADRVKKPW